MADSLFKFFPKRAQTRIPSQFFGEIDFGLRHALDLLPKLYPAPEPFLPLIASDYDRLVVQKNAERLRALFAERGREAAEPRPGALPQPLPQRGNNFCGVCQLRFEDYLAHLAGAEHVASLGRCAAFLSAKELVAELHEQFVRDSLELRLNPRSTRTSRESGPGSPERGSTLSSLYWRSAVRPSTADGCCQTSAPAPEPPTAKKPLRILCARTRCAKWDGGGEALGAEEWAGLRAAMGQSRELCELLRREVAALTRQAFRGRAVSYAQLLPPLHELGG